MNGRGCRKMVLVAAMLSAACSSRTWQSESPSALAARDVLPERVQLVSPEGPRVLEGSRIEGDSLIGFHEKQDGSWKRVAVSVNENEIRVRKWSWLGGGFAIGSAVGLAITALAGG